MTYLIATPDPATGSMSIDLEQTIAWDVFGRVAANGWGSPDFGPAYTAQAPTAQFSVSGGLGRIAVNAVEDTFEVHLDTGQNDHENMIQLVTTTVPTGAPVRTGSVVRFLDGNNYFRAAALIAVGGAVSLEMAARSGGVVHTLSTTVTSLNSASGMFLRTRACGSTFSAKIWYSSTPEPTAWTAEVTFPGLPLGTRAGAFARRDTGNLTPTTFLFDDSWYGTADGPQNGDPPLRLYRVTPDGVETEVRGSPFWTERNATTGDVAYWTGWDNEVPFDVPVFYRMYSACGTLALTSNTETLDSDGDGWLRDPIDPTRNLRIVMDDFFDECVDEDVIVFSGLDSREYANASGIFDRIDAARPATISMKRKNYSSGLYLTSFSLDDVDGLEDIFADGRILSLSLPMIYGWAHRTYGTDYITCDNISQNLMGVDQRVSTRLWEIPFRLSPEPADTSEGNVGGNGIGGGGATYDILAASVIGTTYNSLTASGEVYQGIALGSGY